MARTWRTRRQDHNAHQPTQKNSFLPHSLRRLANRTPPANEPMNGMRKRNNNGPPRPFANARFKRPRIRVKNTPTTMVLTDLSNSNSPSQTSKQNSNVIGFSEGTTTAFKQPKVHDPAKFATATASQTSRHRTLNIGAVVQKQHRSPTHSENEADTDTDEDDEASEIPSLAPTHASTPLNENVGPSNDVLAAASSLLMLDEKEPQQNFQYHDDYGNDDDGIDDAEEEA